jgi:hypothetical protein
LDIKATAPQKRCLSYYCYVYSSTKLEKRVEQVLPGSEGGGGKRERVEGKGEKWLKQCMHI